MSTDAPKNLGEKGAAEQLVGETKALVEGARAAEAQQLDLLGVPDPEAMAGARERLGPKAGQLAVLGDARKAGRRPGSRNKRTEDFRRYILGFGQHPALTMMQIQNTPPEVLVQRSAELDPPKRRMSYGDAQALRVRCAEGLMPFIESKQPVAVELGINGDFNLLLPGQNISNQDAVAAADGTFVLGDWSEVEEPGNGE